MRILFITNLYPPVTLGGYEQACADVARGLRARGHQVAVVTTVPNGPVAAEHEAEVERVLWGKKDSSIAQPLWTARPSVQVQVHNVREVSRLIDGFKPHAVMVWNGMHLGHGLLSAVEKRTRVAYYLQDPWLAGILGCQGPSAPITRRMYHRALGVLGVPSDHVTTNHLIFVSRALRAQYQSMGLEVRGAAVIYHGVAPQTFSLRPQHILRRAPCEPPRVLFAGQVVPQKGVSTLVAALATLRSMEGLAAARLSIIGATPDPGYLLKLEQQMADLRVRGAVDFLPRRPRNDLPKVYAEHDVLAFPSEWEEPFALTLIEAMATGLPVVSSLQGGSAEIVRHGVNALAFRAGDAGDLAHQLATALLDPEQAAAVGRAASAAVLRCHTLDAQVDEVEAYLMAMADDR